MESHKKIGLSHEVGLFDTPPLFLMLPVSTLFGTSTFATTKCLPGRLLVLRENGRLNISHIFSIGKHKAVRYHSVTVAASKALFCLSSINAMTHVLGYFINCLHFKR